MTVELPSSWVERLRLLIVAEEAPLIWLQSERGEGSERLLSRWCKEGLGVPLRPADLENEGRFEVATTKARALGRNTPTWFVAQSLPRSRLNSVEWRELLLPGERLIVCALVEPGSQESREGKHSSDEAYESLAEWLVVPGRQLQLNVGELRELFQLRLADGPAEGASDLATEVPDPSMLRELLKKNNGNLLALERAIIESSGGIGPAPVGQRGGRVKESSRKNSVLEIELLGWPRLTEYTAAARKAGSEESAEESSLEWGYQSVLEVLGALATSPERQLGRDELLRNLWPDLELAEARKHLYPAVSHLRKLLLNLGPGDAVEFKKGVYRLHRDWHWSVDVDKLTEVLRSTRSLDGDLLAVDVRSPLDRSEKGGLEQGSIERLKAGWRLVRGDFLQGFDNEWVRLKRAEIRIGHQLILRRLACLLMLDGQNEEVEEVLRSLLIQDRVQEDAHLAMMRLYAQRGRTDLARRQYEKMCSALQEDLGMQPMDNTVREVERILASSA